MQELIIILIQCAGALMVAAGLVAIICGYVFYGIVALLYSPFLIGFSFIVDAACVYLKKNENSDKKE